MRVKRYQEDTMQAAMAKVRAELGKDAVLISNRRVNGKVEVIAAAEDEPKPAPTPVVAPRPSPPAPRIVQTSRRARLDTQPAADDNQAMLLKMLQEKKLNAQNQVPSLMQMQDELGRLRKLFEGELAQLVWRDTCERQPNRKELLSRLDAIDITSELSVKVADKILPCSDMELAWRRALRLLVIAIKRPAYDPLIEGGVIALVGPTGVGKTTTAAKIAAQFALRHGRNQVALITTDDFRVGRQEQLISLGSSIGVPVQVAVNEKEMEKTLDSFSTRKLVIIDTAGINQRNRDLKTQYDKTVGVNRKISPYLVLNATAQASVINDTIKAFSKIKLAGAVVSKTDENVSIGAVVSGLIRSRLPVAYVGIGQKIPDDLQKASAEFFHSKLLESYADAMKQNQPRKVAMG